MAESNFKTYISSLNESLLKLSHTSINNALSLMNQTINSNNTIWIAGNGGSAATASHFATDLSRCNNNNGDPVKGISLCDNSGLITAIGNDFGFDFVFFKQLSNLAIKGDLFITLSASGNSKNLLVAMEWAKSNGVRNLALTGFDGGKAIHIAENSLHVPTQLGEYGLAEDAHSILCHYLSLQFRTD